MRVELAYGRSNLIVDLPEHGRYAALLAEAGSPEGILDMITQSDFSVQDQWQVQIQVQIQRKADVYVYSDGLTDEQIENRTVGGRKSEQMGLRTGHCDPFSDYSPAADIYLT